MWWEYGVPNAEPKPKKKFKPLPLHYYLTEETWKRYRPKGWSRIPFKIAKKYGWYISVTTTGEYLVMPILRASRPVFESARRLTGDGSKYIYPKGVDKHVWLSGKIGNVALIAEGVADAAYLSQLGSSIALLGSFVGPEVVTLTKKKGVSTLLLFDGDIKGREATIKALTLLPWAKPVFLPEDKDPTDLSLNALRKLILKQTGVKL